MQCPECGSPLMIASSNFEFKNDDSPDTPTELYSVLTMVCVNSSIDLTTKMPKCSQYCGPDLYNPLKIAATVRNKVK